MIKLEDLFTKEITNEDILKKIKNKDEYIGLILVKKIDYEDNLCMEGFCEAEIETLYKETEIKIWWLGNEVPDCLKLENCGKTYKLYAFNENIISDLEEENKLLKDTLHMACTKTGTCYGCTHLKNGQCGDEEASYFCENGGSDMWEWKM